MLLLFDTSTTTAVVALASGEGTPLIGERIYPRARGGSSRLLSGAVEMLEEAGSDISLLTGLVISRGPGSYTGLRVGYALAQGLSESLGIPVTAIPSWSSFARKFHSRDISLCVCYDARSRGTAWITFPADSEGPIRSDAEGAGGSSAILAEDVVELGEEGILLQIAPAEAVPGLVPRPCRLVGPGVDTFLAGLEGDPPHDMEVVTGSARAEPADLLDLGTAALKAEEVELLQTLPLYLGTMEAAPRHPGR